MTGASDLRDMNLIIRLGTGMTFRVGDGRGELAAQTYAYVYEARYSERTGKELKPRLLWGPLGVPDKPQASHAELLRLLADALDEEADVGLDT